MCSSAAERPTLSGGRGNPPLTFDWVDDERVAGCPARPLQRRVRWRGNSLNPLSLLGQKRKSFVDPLAY
jgi:hypothetical protein